MHQTNTLKWKRQFIRSLCNSVRDHVLSKVKDMPQDWDGHQLRLLIAESFDSEVTEAMRKDRKAMRAYRMAVYNQNLR